MDEQLQEDWLDRRLREEMPYIDDAGFTARVVQKLPAPVSRQSWRAAILISVTLLASVVTYLASDGGRFLIVAVLSLRLDAAGLHKSRRHLRHADRDGGGRERRARPSARDSLGRAKRGALGEDLARLGDIACDLLAQRGQTLKLSLRPKVMQKPQLDVFAIEVAVEIEDVKLEHTLRQAITNRWAHSEIHYPAKGLPAQQSLGDINSVRRKLLTVRAQVGGRETQSLRPSCFPSSTVPRIVYSRPSISLCGLEIAQLPLPSESPCCSRPSRSRSPARPRRR